jgi:hypothetical protein
MAVPEVGFPKECPRNGVSQGVPNVVQGVSPKDFHQKKFPKWTHNGGSLMEFPQMMLQGRSPRGWYTNGVLKVIPPSVSPSGLFPMCPTKGS